MENNNNNNKNKSESKSHKVWEAYAWAQYRKFIDVWTSLYNQIFEKKPEGSETNAENQNLKDKEKNTTMGQIMQGVVHGVTILGQGILAVFKSILYLTQALLAVIAGLACRAYDNTIAFLSHRSNKKGDEIKINNSQTQIINEKSENNSNKSNENQPQYNFWGSILSVFQYKPSFNLEQMKERAINDIKNIIKNIKDNELKEEYNSIVDKIEKEFDEDLLDRFMHAKDMPISIIYYAIAYSITHYKEKISSAILKIIQQYKFFTFYLNNLKNAMNLYDKKYARLDNKISSEEYYYSFNLKEMREQAIKDMKNQYDESRYKNMHEYIEYIDKCIDKCIDNVETDCIKGDLANELFWLMSDEKPISLIDYTIAYNFIKHREEISHFIPQELDKATKHHNELKNMIYKVISFYKEQGGQWTSQQIEMAANTDLESIVNLRSSLRV